MENILNLGTCLSFDGVTQQATIPNNAAYSLTTTGQLSISIWAYPAVPNMPHSGGTGYVGFFSKNEPSNEHEWEFRWYNESNTETNLRCTESDFYLFSPTGGLGASAIYQASKYNYGRWRHWVGTLDGTYMYLYLDGQLVNFANYVTYPVTPGATNAILRVGANNNTPAFFQGYIGPMKIWNRKLTANEVMEQYTSNASNTNGLVGYWVADQTNNRLTDLSVIGNNGILINNPTFIQGLVTERKVTQGAPRHPETQTQGLQLNGTTQYAYISNATQIGLNVGTNDFMVAFRAKFSGSKTSSYTLVDMHDTGHTNPNDAGATGWNFIWESTNNFRAQQGNGTTTASTSAITTNIFDGEYHDFAFVHAPSTNINQIWIDGIKVINGTGGPVGSWSSNGDFCIGVRENKTGQFFKGTIYNIYFYLWSKVPSNYFYAIQDLHNFGTTSYNTGLVSLWTMNGNANDSVGPNNLTLVGAPTFVGNVPMTTRKVASNRNTATGRNQA